MGPNARGGPLSLVNTGDGHQGAFTIQDHIVYYPLFCLTEVPDKYFDMLNHFAESQDFNWIAITSKMTDQGQLLADLRSHLDNSSSTPTPMPFIGSTINEVYDFFIKTLCRPVDQEQPGLFTDHTFLAVNEECLRDCAFSIAEATEERFLPNIIVVTDAPDFGQTEPTIQHFPSSLANAFTEALAIEELCATPQELARPKPPPGREWPTLRVMPSATLSPIEPLTDSDEQRFRIATRREGWLRKHDFIRKAEVEDWDILKTLE